MFTGLIEATGHFKQLKPQGTGQAIVIDGPWPESELSTGESIAVNGVCLTLTRVSGRTMEMDLSPETLERTCFKQLRPGSPLNLERSLRLGDRMGGHLVTGHVDGLGTFAGREKSGESELWYFQYPKEYGDFLVEKGSVAVDGISLTVVTVEAERFSAAIIPETIKRTNLDGVKAGRPLHLEFDLIAKYLAKLAGRRIGQERENQPSISVELLAKKGFLG